MRDLKGYKGFCSFIKGRSVALIGLGVSNLPLIPFLYQCGAKSITARDERKSKNDPSVLFAKENRASVLLGNDAFCHLDEEIIIRSPGIRPDLQAFVQAEKNGSRVYCETELFFQFVPCKSIAVTGSDGKTTTTTLISKILQEGGYHVCLGGNIGKAMLPQLADCEEANTISVTELSSFQLMRQRYSPDVAVITNLSENHLDWHRDMSEYLSAKRNLIQHQSKEGVAILNFDNSHTRESNVSGSVRYFSTQSNSFSDGVYFDGKTIYLLRNHVKEELLNASDIILPGKHNVENYMAAILATLDFVDPKAVKSVAKTFGGVEHRIEFVRERHGVRYYNSSIDSSPTRSIACLRSFAEKVIVIAGGYDKNLDYAPFGSELCRRCKILLLCGNTSDKIQSAVENCNEPTKPKILRLNSLDDCVKKASEIASSGDFVILTPASASFDQFKNFEERGNAFKKAVAELS